jgi:hypothetical protein
MKTILRPALMLYAAYATLLYIIVYAAEVYITLSYPGASILPIYALEILLSIVSYLGWLSAGSKFKNPLLFNISLVAVWLVPVAGVLNALLLYAGSMTILYTGVSSFVMGLIVTVFGAALLRMKKRFGKLAQVTGWLDIITGISLLSFILLPIAVLIMPPVLVLEALLLFRAYEKASRGRLSRLLFWRSLKTGF